ncbi:MAG: ABC transporter permease [Hyphomicrobiales bacterium]|nr:MAG: ABC transporter permease [Hyphomicrobiales bacterium]
MSATETGAPPSPFARLRPRASGAILSSLVAIVLALLIGAILIIAWGANPLTAYLALLVGLALPDMPPLVVIPTMILTAAVVGAFWSLVAGVLKMRFGANELITTIMLNYIAILFVSFLLRGPLQEAAGYLPQTERLASNARFPSLIEGTRLHYGFLLAVLAVIGCHFALWHTTWGFKLRVVGLNARAAFNSGYKVTAITISAFLVSGALAGLAGYMEVVGVQRRMIENLSPGFGYTGIIVALLGRTNPIGVLAAAILFAALQVGGTTMQTASGVPSTLTTIIQGLIVLFVIGSGAFDFLAKRKRAD